MDVIDTFLNSIGASPKEKIMARGHYLIEDPHNNCITIRGDCALTGKKYSVTISLQEWHNWNSGMSIQQAMPLRTLDEREFLISGVSPIGFQSLNE